MGNEKDITEKKLEAYNDVFADIANVLMFDGEEIIKPEELEQAKTRSSYIGDERLREQERDEAKFWRKHNVRISMIGFENETAGDPDEPLRVIGYDGAGYRDQLYSVGSENGGYVRNTDPRYPVITLVLYFGNRRWSAPKTLYENLGGVPDILRPFVNDYRINLFEIAFLDEETVKKFRSDFRIVADFFVQQRKNEYYTPPPDKLRHVNEILQLMSYLTKDKRFEQAYEENVKGVEYTNMCEILDRTMNRRFQQGIEQGIEQGIKQGIKQGIEQGINQGIKQGIKQGIEQGINQGIEQGTKQGTEKALISAIKNLMKTLKLTAKQAMDALMIPEEEQAKYAEKLQ